MCKKIKTSKTLSFEVCWNELFLFKLPTPTVSKVCIRNSNSKVKGSVNLSVQYVEFMPRKDVLLIALPRD